MTRKKIIDPLQELRQRWWDKTGYEMPESIASLPIDKVQRAVEWTEQGMTVAVPVERQQQKPAESSADSMMDWDRQSEF